MQFDQFDIDPIDLFRRGSRRGPQARAGLPRRVQTRRTGQILGLPVFGTTAGPDRRVGPVGPRGLARRVGPRPAGPAGPAGPGGPIHPARAGPMSDFRRQQAGQLGTLNKSQFKRLYQVVYMRAWNEVNAREKGRRWEALLEDVFVDVSSNSQMLNISANVVATKARDKKKHKWTVRIDVPSSLWGMNTVGDEAQLKTRTVSHMQQGSDFTASAKRWKLLKNGTMIHRATGKTL